jgi:hypothetical protein
MEPDGNLRKRFLCNDGVITTNAIGAFVDGSDGFFKRGISQNPSSVSFFKNRVEMGM